MSEAINEKAKTGSDYVKEAYECFLKDKPDDTEPLSVIRAFYEKNASDELKTRCAAEGKTVEGAYEFMFDVARKAGGKSISDSVGLSICMHYFQDVPAMEDFEPVIRKEAEKRRAEERKAKDAEKKASAKTEKRPKPKTEKPKKPVADDGTADAPAMETQDVSKAPEKPIDNQLCFTF